MSDITSNDIKNSLTTFTDVLNTDTQVQTKTVLDSYEYGLRIPCPGSTDHTGPHMVRYEDSRNFEQCLLFAHSRNEAFYHDNLHCITYNWSQTRTKNMHVWAPKEWLGWGCA